MNFDLIFYTCSSFSYFCFIQNKTPVNLDCLKLIYFCSKQAVWCRRGLFVESALFIFFFAFRNVESRPKSPVETLNGRLKKNSLYAYMCKSAYDNGFVFIP